jgi:hypothetical protein
MYQTGCQIASRDKERGLTQFKKPNSRAIFFSLTARKRRIVNTLGRGRCRMVSIDHFRQELLAQMGLAATRGRMDILINSSELCRSIRNGELGTSTCCDAMQEEIKPGDVLLLERTDGAGMTVRYLLPRANSRLG